MTSSDERLGKIDVEYAGATLDQLAFAEESLKYLEKSIRESGNLQKLQQTGLIERTSALSDGTIDGRVGYLENFIIDWLKEHRKHLHFNHIQHRSRETLLESLEASIADNVDKCNSLEKAMTKSADKLTNHQTAQAEQEESMKIRLESFAKKIELIELDTAIHAGAKQNQLLNFEDRMRSLETSMVDKLKNHQIAYAGQEESMKIRLESLEAWMRDDADTMRGQLARVEERMHSLEVAMAESADCQMAHAEHEESMKIRLDSLAEEIGLRELDNAILAGAKRNQLFSVEERMRSLETAMADKLTNDQIARAGHEETTKNRLESLEAWMRDNIAKEAEVAKENLAVVERISSFEKNAGESTKARLDSLETLASVEERMNSLEKSKAESADKLNNCQFAYGNLEKWMKTRLESLEALIGDNKQKLGHSDEALGHDHLARVDKRMNFLQESLEKSADELRNYQIAHGEHEKSMRSRLESLEVLIDDNADRYVKETKIAKEKHEELAQESLGDLDYLQLASEHMDTLEESMAEEVLKTLQTSHKEHKVAQEKLGYFDNANLDCARQNQLESERTDSDEKSITKSAEVLRNHQTTLRDGPLEDQGEHFYIGSPRPHGLVDRGEEYEEDRLEFLENKVSKIPIAHAEFGDIHKVVAQYLDYRLEFLETRIGDSAEKHWKEIEAAKAKLGDIPEADINNTRHFLNAVRAWEHKCTTKPTSDGGHRHSFAMARRSAAAPPDDFPNPPQCPAHPGPPPDEFFAKVLNESEVWEKWHDDEDKRMKHAMQSAQEMVVEARRAWQNQKKDEVRSHLSALDCPAQQGWFTSLDSGPDVIALCGGGSQTLAVEDLVRAVTMQGFDEMKFKEFLEKEKQNWIGKDVNLLVAAYVEVEMDKTTRIPDPLFEADLKSMELEAEQARERDHKQRLNEQIALMENRRREMYDEVERQYLAPSISFFLDKAKSYVSACEVLKLEWDDYDWKRSTLESIFQRSLCFYVRGTIPIPQPAEWHCHPVLKHANNDDLAQRWADIHIFAVMASSVQKDLPLALDNFEGGGRWYSANLQGKATDDTMLRAADGHDVVNGRLKEMQRSRMALDLATATDSVFNCLYR